MRVTKASHEFYNVEPKPDTKEYILYDFIYIIVTNRKKLTHVVIRTVTFLREKERFPQCSIFCPKWRLCWCVHAIKIYPMTFTLFFICFTSIKKFSLKKNNKQYYWSIPSFSELLLSALLGKSLLDFLTFHSSFNLLQLDFVSLHFFQTALAKITSDYLLSLFDCC